MKKGKMRAFLALAVAAMLLALCWFLAALLFDNQAGGAEYDIGKFFGTLRSEQIYDAYEECAARLKEVSFEGFEQSIESHGLGTATNITWTNREVGGTEATFSGEIDLADGNRDEITVKMVRERGKWRVYSIVSERAGNMITESRGIRVTGPGQEADENAGTLAVPPDEELQQLVNVTLMRFNEAIQIEYFGPFYQLVSTAWQQQTSPAALLTAFKVFIDKEVSFAALRDAKAEFILQPFIDEYGILQTEGYYMDGSTRFNFRMKFIRERGEWKLFGIDLSLVQDSGLPGGG